MEAHSAQLKIHDAEGRIDLRIPSRKVTLLHVEAVRSSFYGDRTRFPEGSIAFDHGLLMRDIPHEWHALPS